MLDHLGANRLQVEDLAALRGGDRAVRQPGAAPAAAGMAPVHRAYPDPARRQRPRFRLVLTRAIILLCTSSN
jgi:hypothetical protein